MSGHLAHGPANRGRRLLDTAAPLFVCEPRTSPRGGVVIVHDLFGLTHDAEAAARRLAADGWLAVAPFLYHGHGGPVFRDLPTARAELASLSLAALGGDIAAAVSYLAERGCPATVVLGFGTGGYLAGWSVSAAARDTLAGETLAGTPGTPGGQVVAGIAVSAADLGGSGTGFPPFASFGSSGSSPSSSGSSASFARRRTAPLLELSDSPAEEALWRRVGAFLSEVA